MGPGALEDPGTLGTLGTEKMSLEVLVSLVSLVVLVSLVDRVSVWKQKIIETETDWGRGAARDIVRNPLTQLTLCCP